MRRSARLWPIVFHVEGLNIGRFIRYAGEQGIRLTDVRRPSVRRMTGAVQETDLSRLQEIAIKGGWKLTTGRRRGAGKAAEWLRCRWFLAALIIIAVLSILLSEQIMWDVQIIGGGAYEADIRMALEEAGVVPPKLRRRIDPDSLRSQLEWRYPRIAWIECGWRGNVLVIHPVEGNLPRKEGEYDGACDVIALRDGIIASLVTRAGTPVVQVGDIVRKGDVLIRGEERTSEGAVKQVAARGSVKARVWEGASVRMPAVETVTQYSGRQETVWTIRTPWFDLWRIPSSDFAQYDVSVSQIALGGIFLPTKVHVETRMEAEVGKQMRDQKELEDDAYAAALHKLREKVGSEESLIDIWGNCSMIDTENIVSVAIGEMLVEIGTQAPVSGMAAPGE